MKIIIAVKCVWYFFWGKTLSLFYYKKEYLDGRYFSGNFKGITSIGWTWATYDCISRILLGVNKDVPWPVSGKSTVTNYQNIKFDLDDLHIFQSPGTYFQAKDAEIFIGRGSWIAPNVGLITANHKFDDLNAHEKGKDIIIGQECWIGMNSVILPGVIIGDNTIVGAGSVVTKSFLSGNCIIAGNPAKIIKSLI